MEAKTAPMVQRIVDTEGAAKAWAAIEAVAITAPEAPLAWRLTQEIETTVKSGLEVLMDEAITAPVSRAAWRTAPSTGRR